MKQKFLLIVSILIGVVAAALTHFYFQTEARERQKERDQFLNRMQPVVVVAANRYIPAGTELKYDDLVRIQMFAPYVTYDNILEPDFNRILGRKLMQSVEADKPVLWSYIDGGRERPGTLSQAISAGKRGTSISISGAAGVSGLIRPNDRVDVLGSFVRSAEGAAEEKEMATLTLLQNVTVLAIGSETHKTIQDNARGAGGGYSAVTLDVSPREAEMLVHAMHQGGRLFLTLRNPSDMSFEKELPRVDFKQIESELKNLNDLRQQELRSMTRRP